MNDFEQLPLRDIHLPDPVSWWPPAPAWWLLPVLLALAAAGAWWGWKYYARRRRPRKLLRRARIELDRITTDYEATGDAGQLLQELSILVRRVAMSLHPRQEVAGMCGGEWAAWLKRSDSGDGLGQSALELLVEGPYRKTKDFDPLPVVPACREWLRTMGRHTSRRKRC
jgi:hypothetical protein